MKKIRIVIDILMFIIMTILMGHYVTSNLIHEVIGVLLFILFITHLILNIRYYKTLFKGKYSTYRKIQLVINISLTICMIGLIISSLMISSDVFKFLNIETTMFARNLHMLSSSWGYIIMSIHLGMHLVNAYKNLFNKLKNSTFEYIVYLIMIVMFICGIYSFINLGFYKDMFLIYLFKYYDYNVSFIVFYLKNVMVVYSITMIVYMLRRKKDKK